MVALFTARLDAVADQETSEPKAVVACLVANLESDWAATVAGRSCCKASEDIEQSGCISPWNECGGDLGASRQKGTDEPLGAAQLKSDVAVLCPCGGHGRCPCSSV